jgi:hypothetical protein
MSFAVPADSYDSYMGRYSRLLAPQFTDLVYGEIRCEVRVRSMGAGPAGVW